MEHQARTNDSENTSRKPITVEEMAPRKLRDRRRSFPRSTGLQTPNILKTQQQSCFSGSAYSFFGKKGQFVRGVSGITQSQTDRVRVPGTAEIDDLRTAISVLLESGAFEAVKGIGYALPHVSSSLICRSREPCLATTDDTLVLIVAKGALVADPHEGCGSDVAITDGAFAIALVAEAP